MVNELKDRLCHVCDLALCWSVKSCSYSVVFGFIRISKHKLGNSLQRVFFFSFWLIKMQYKETIKANFSAGNVFNKNMQHPVISICAWWTVFGTHVHMIVFCLAPFFTACSHHKNLKSSRSVPTSSTSTHVQTHWRTLPTAGLKDRLSEPLSVPFHHKERTLVFPPLAHWSHALCF